MLKNPCHKCEERHLKCASHCKRWKKYTEKRNEIYRKRKQTANETDMMCEYIRKKSKRLK